MSMHEIEDAVEDAIRMLHDHGDGLDHRSIFWNLLRLQEAFGTTPVRFRVLDILLERRFAYRLSLEGPALEGSVPEGSVPEGLALEGLALEGLGIEGSRIEAGQGGSGLEDLLGGAEAVEALRAIEGSEDVGLDPTRPIDPISNPRAGYVRDGALYGEAGSILWRRLVERGALSGADALDPTPISTLELACLIAEVAEIQGETDLIRGWHGLVQGELYAGVEAMVGPQDLDEVQAIPAARRLRDIAARSGALDDLDFGGAAPPRAFIAASATLSWWYNLT